LLGIAASLDLEIEQLDEKTSFLHGDLQEEIYMKRHQKGQGETCMQIEEKSIGAEAGSSPVVLQV